MKFFKKVGVSAISLVTLFSTAFAIPTRPVSAAEEFRGQLKSVDSVKADGNIVDLSFNGGAVEGRITFLEDGIFRYNVDPTGKFDQYATPNSASHTGTIQAQPDDSDMYSHPDATVNETADTYEISTESGTTIVFDKDTAQMTVKNAKGDVVMSENKSLTIDSSTVQNLKQDEDEYFFGGGTQNGRFTHKGKTINIKNESGWTDGKVASPNPFYWSTAGYGVLRNTFKQGTYNFGNGIDNVQTTHNEKEFDAYYFVSNDDNVADMANTLLNEYYAVTGNPMLLPEYAFYLAHLNCYNRDGWGETPVDSGGWVLEDGKRYNEYGKAAGYVIPEGTAAESLNNQGPTFEADQFKGKINDDTYKFSARAVIDGYSDYDMPLGWFLPNDGYGCGYGQNGYYEERTETEKANDDWTRANAVVDANVENLAKFTEYAEGHGVRTGLWTQAALTPAESEKDSRYIGFQSLRDFQKEVTKGGVSALKTDVAWVGQGYSMALNSVKDGYNILSTNGQRPSLVSLDGWAGFQRYASIWTGDQSGGDWEYIRFHIPTYIGQSLSGNPNIGSDVDGIHGGSNLITTRDLQFKTFTQTMLNMDGWGSLAKKPYNHGDPYTSINRMYLKLKAQLMPYIYTAARESVDGLPMIRAMFLEEANDYTYSTATQYQYMFGDNFLVAPVYQNTNADEIGNDIRNDIYLPGNTDIWVDYFTGEQYRGGQIINNFDAPIWKLPLFVKNGSIIPMYENHNNPMEVSEDNTMGLDKTRRIIEFYPYGETSYDLFEDDGISMTLNDDGKPDYGENVKTHMTSSVKDGTATLTVEPSKGTYEGYDSNRHSTFVVNVSAKPKALTAKNGKNTVDLKEVNSYEEFEVASANNEAVYFYDESPNMNKYAMDGEAFKDTKITTTPKLYVSFPKTDVNENAQTLIVEGFINDSDALNMKDEKNDALEVPGNVRAPEQNITPTSIDVVWDEVEGATFYEIMVDGMLNNTLDVEKYSHINLVYDSLHTYQVRARNVDGYSDWSEPLEVRTLLDPWRNTPKPENISWSGNIWNGHNASLAFDNTFQTGDGGFHSNNGGINEELIVDYGKGYNIETIEYYPRTDAGNGTVTKMEFSTSLDGVHWSEIRTFDWAADATMKPIDNVGPARYLKFVARASVGTFFSASEIKVIADEGRRPFVIGSIAGQHREHVTDADYTNLNNYKGLSVKDNPTFDTQIKNYAMDINMNGIYDVYDYTYTLYKLPEGVTNTKQGAVTGSGTLVPSVESLNTGETLSIDVTLNNVDNLDALGEVIDYDPELLEFVSVTKGNIIESMTDLTINKVYDDGTAYVNLAYVNRGDQAVCEGSGVAATITMKAKTDIANVRDAIDLSKVSLYGPDVLNSDPGLQPSENALVSTTANSSGAVSAKRAIGPNKESVVTVEFDMVTTLDPNQTNAIVSLGSSDSNYTAYSQMPVVIRMYKDGTFGAHNGSTFVQSNLRFNKNEYYHIKVTIDLEAKKWSAIVSDEAGKETVIADNYGFRSTAQVPENIGKIYLVNNEAQAGKFWLENIKLYDGETDTSINFGLDDFDITMTNEFLPNDDGSNVEKLIQNGKNNGYTKLFDGNKEGSSARDFELLWDIESNYVDGKLPEYIALPLTMHLDLKEDALVDQVKVYNANKANGYLTSAKAQLVYTDGTKGEEVVISDMQSVYEFNFDSAKDVDRIDITFLTAIKADGTAVNNMLTLAEIEATGHLATTEEDKLINSAVTNVEAIDNGSDSADRMFDGSLTTYWESPWSGAQATLPKDVVMTLNDVYSLDTLEFISHTIRNGGITKYEVYTSTDEENWTKVAEGTVDAEEYKQGKNVTVSVAMAGVDAKYVKLVALESVGRIESEDNMYARIAEMNLYGTKAEIIEVDKTALSEAIIAAEALNESDYTADSWAVLANALITAKEILTNEEATQVDVDAAKDALLIAIDALLPNTHKEALEIALELANKITEHDLENVVPAVVEEFIAARAEADEVYNDAKASQEQINKAFDRLAKAMHMLDFIKGDKTALKAFIDKVEGLKDSKDQYTQASWDALEEVLAKAVGVYDNPNAMQEEVNNAYKELVTAFLNLRLIPDKSLLEELINKAEGLNGANYTKATFDGLTKALNEAKAVFDNPNVTQEQIDNAKATLEKAINSLEANVNTPVDNAVSTPVNNGDVTVSVETGDNSLTGIFATMALLSIAGYTILKRKEN